MNLINRSIRTILALLTIIPAITCAHPGHQDHDEPPRISTPQKLQAVSGDTSQTSEIPTLRLPILHGEARPWTSTTMNNDPRNFQFAIVTDRSGGIRPGIFESAVDKINLLQPEFVMSVGDLIQGYNSDPDALDAMWDEFEGIVSKFQMPFFYVPGNHDLSNPVQKQEWHDRFGPNYYHFVYGDTLFLCLDTEDNGHGALSQEQVDYFRKVLQVNSDVRWTLLFMHRPIWLKSELQGLNPDIKSDVELLKKSRWYDMEKMLKGRKYTVYAGHVHSYTQYQRQGSKYYILATTGGGSALRGDQNYGQFDEVVWITLTDNGPIMANLRLDGILPEDLRTNEVATLVYRTMSGGVTAQVAVTDSVPFSSTTLSLKLRNRSSVPMTMELRPPAKPKALRFEPESATVIVPPGASKNFDFFINGSKLSKESQLDGLAIDWTASFKLKGKPKIVVDHRTAIDFDPQRKVTPAVAGTAIDGQFAEWDKLWSTPQRFQEVIGKKHAWLGMADASVQIASQYDDKFVYLAARVTDDSVVPAEGDLSKHSDSIELFVQPATAQDPASTSSLRLQIAPSGKSPSGVVERGSHGIDAVCVQTDEGYDVEIAVPVEQLTENPTQPWEKFRLNLRINDAEIKGSKRAKLWWTPHWESQQSYPESGTFVRQQ